MDTPITVSSTSTVPNKSDFLQLNYSPRHNEESIISLGSTSFERVPVSWSKKNNAFPRTDSNTTLSNIQKVTDWIESIDEPKHESVVVDLEDNSNDNFKQSSRMEVGKDEFNSESKSIILFRCDFKKSVSPKAYYPPVTPYSRSAPLINYLKKENKGRDHTDKKHSSTNNEVVIHKHLLLRRSDSNKNVNHCNQYNNTVMIENEGSKMNDGKSDGSSEVYEVPLSPESRKKELCSYLQLMNPADKKERLIFQNRRSTRVRNLTAIQEKRKMKNIKMNASDKSDRLQKDTEKSPTLKSFKELNIRVEKAKFGHNDKVSESEIEKNTFCFPFPSKELTMNIQDFDNTMSKLVSRYKRICRIKKLQVNCNVGLTKCVPNIKEHHVKNMLTVQHKANHAEKNSIQKKRNIAKNNKVKGARKSMNKKEGRLKNLLKKKFKRSPSASRTNSLRSTGRLKNVSLKKLIGKKEKELLNRKNTKKKAVQTQRKVETKLEQYNKKSESECLEVNSNTKFTNPHCEIVSVPKNNEENFVDIENLMDDMIDFNNLSEEHKKCLMENRILSTKRTSTSSATDEPSRSFYSLQEISPLYGFDKADINDVRKICEVYKNSILKDEEEVMKERLCGTDEIKLEDVVEHKTEPITAIEKLASSFSDSHMDFLDLNDSKLDIQDDAEEDSKSTNSKPLVANGISLQEHDYAELPSDDEVEEEKSVDVVVPCQAPKRNVVVRSYMEISPRIQKNMKFEVLPYNKSVEMKSLHKSLQHVKKNTNSSLADQSFTREWDTDNLAKQKSKKQSHYISISKENGAVLKAFYIDFNLIVCQENVVSFWMQTPLGNVLGSQNMWIPRGQTQRLILNGKCMQKESMEMVIAMESQVAYIELWTKEHKSEIREGPVADVFATIYFSKQRQSGLCKKVLQLENINGFADDVQYSVMKSVQKIIVSWHSAHDDCTPKRTFIHAYELAADYQTVANIYNIEPVDHYVSSLHNIEECDNLIMGCGENKITLWNVDYGYIVATIALSEIKSPLSTLWVKCDRGFLFALQQCVDRELRLIAINGINHSWKKLASYIPPEGFDRLRGVCIENGLLLSFYDQGILCWKAETGEPVEETNIESEIIPSGRYVILIEDEQILVKHAMTHLMSLSIDET